MVNYTVAAAESVFLIYKVAAEELILTLDWSAVLGAETITVSAWAADAGIVTAGGANTNTTATIEITGGTVGTTYKVRNTATTSGGQVLVQDLTVMVVEFAHALWALVVELLGGEYDPAVWTGQVLAAGLRQALRHYNGLAAVKEATVAVAAGTYELDLSGIADLGGVLAVAYPWDDGLELGKWLRSWRLVDGTTLRTDQAFVAGENVRIRYRPRHAVKGLDGAASTTVPPADLPLLSLGAAGWAVITRVRQLAEAPEVPKERIGDLCRLADRWLAEYQSGLAALAQRTAPVAWDDIGL
jgi:hypothetical protein